ncbi:hypothetical protein [Novosphingobium kaempferiae]|nr:hypothetical protein [Novosphingobium kaempferiae]
MKALSGGVSSIVSSLPEALAGRIPPFVIASAAKQSGVARGRWIASLRSQ